MRSSDDNFKGKFNWSEGNRKDCRKLRKYWRKSLASFLLAFILAFGPVGSAFAQEIVADKSERVEKEAVADDNSGSAADDAAGNTLAEEQKVSDDFLKNSTEALLDESADKKEELRKAAVVTEETENKILAGNEEAASEQALAAEEAVNANEWVAADFKYREIPVPGTEDEEGYPDVYYGVSGLSDIGKEKLESNKSLTLPDKDSKGKTPVWVDENAFKGLGIEELTVPGNYTHIQDRAFEKNAIRTLTLEEGVIYANSYAFLDNKIEEINFPSTFKYAATGAFKNNQIKSITFPDSCELIGPESFMNNKITDITFGNNTKRIFAKAFKGNQITELNIPLSLKNTYEGLKGIETDAFDDNPGLVNPEKPSQKKVILWTENRDNPNNLINRGNFIVDPSTENNTYTAKDFTVENGVLTGFSASGKRKYDKLGKTVELNLPERDVKSNPIKEIGDSAFYDDMPEVDKIVIPQGYTKISDMAFWEAVVNEVELPDSLESIGENAFYRQAGDTVTGYVSSSSRLNAIDNKSDFVKLEVRGSSPQAPQESSQWLKSDFNYEEISLQEGETTIKVYAVAGFSDAGKEKYKTNKKLELPETDAEGKQIEAVADRAFVGSFPTRGLESVTIPEGYTYIGAMSFAFNSIGGELVLPASLKDFGLGAFFRNEIAQVEIPAQVTYIPISCFRGNKLSKLVFKGNITAIDNFAFRENRLEEVNIPDSLESIGKQAFAQNTGKAGYGGKLVLRTASGNNPKNLPESNEYIVDPKAPENPDDIDYSKWTAEDFKYTNQRVDGFSAQGYQKVKKNRKLIIPDLTPDNKPVLEIDQDAFRGLNVNFDLESVKIPDTVVEIGDYAFQFNDLTEFTLPRDLETLGMGVVMANDNLSKINFNQKLKYIDQACFFACPLKELELPASVEVVRNAAFRKCSLKTLTFAGNNLKKIDSLAFADNSLTEVKLPEGLEEIGSQAFGNNQFTELDIPDSLKTVKIQAFVGNPGIKKYNGAVVLHTKDKKNINKIPDDISGTFVIDPEVLASEADIAALRAIVERLEGIDKESLGKGFKEYFTETLAGGKRLLETEKVSAANIGGAIENLKFAEGRVELSRQMGKKEALENKASDFNKTLWDDVDIAYNYAKRYLMVVNISDEKVKQLAGDLELAISRLDSEGIYGKEYYDGEAEVMKTHYIEPYTIKVRVWVKDGRIVYVQDNKTESDDPNEDEKHNEGYLETAKPVLLRYIGKSVEEINASANSSDLGIDAISTATVSSYTYYQAVKAALAKLQPDKPNPPKPDNNGNDNNSGENNANNNGSGNNNDGNNGNNGGNGNNNDGNSGNNGGNGNNNGGNNNNTAPRYSGGGGGGSSSRSIAAYAKPENKPSESLSFETLETVKEGEWSYENGSWYYKKDDKIAKSAWILDNGRWFIVDETGRLVENKWAKVNGKWFFAESGGYLAENKWILNGNNWFYAESDGSIAEDKWISLDGKWYFAKKGGYIAASSWVDIGGKAYYFDKDGSLLVNTQIEGHNVDSDGARIN